CQMTVVKGSVPIGCQCPVSFSCCSNGKRSKLLMPLKWRGAGAVERGGLENRCPSYGGPGVRITPSQTVCCDVFPVDRGGWCAHERDDVSSVRGAGPPLQLIRRLALIPGRVTCRSPLRGARRGQRLSYHRKVHRPEATTEAPAWSSYPTAAGPVLP